MRNRNEFSRPAVRVHEEMKISDLAQQYSSGQCTVRTKYASADGKRRNDEGCRVKSCRHRESAIFIAQSKFVKETMKHDRFEYIDRECK